MESFFLQYGAIEDCTIVFDKCEISSYRLVSVDPIYPSNPIVSLHQCRSTGKSKGFGFVVFKEMESAYACLEQPNKDLEGRKISCNLAALRGN